MKVLILALFLISTSFAAVHHRRRLQEPVTTAGAMAIFSELAKNIKVEVKVDGNQLFDQCRSLMMNPPGDAYSVLVNGTTKTEKFEGCPSTSVGRLMGCNPHTTTAGKSNFITKPHGLIQNNQILVRVEGKDVQVIQEGYFYTYTDTNPNTNTSTKD